MPVDGTLEVQPLTTTTYTLTVTGSGGEDSSPVTVIVIDDLPPSADISSPAEGAILEAGDVSVDFDLSGDLQTGDHLHLTLDDNPHVTITEISGTHVFSDVEPGDHTLIAQVARPSHIIYEYPESRELVNFSVSAGTPQSISWNSYDAQISGLTPQATILDSSGSSVLATLEFYESDTDNGVDGSNALDTFLSSHPEGFNNIENVWSYRPNIRELSLCSKECGCAWIRCGRIRHTYT